MYFTIILKLNCLIFKLMDYFELIFHNRNIYLPSFKVLHFIVSTDYGGDEK